MLYFSHKLLLTFYQPFDFVLILFSNLEPYQYFLTSKQSHPLDLLNQIANEIHNFLSHRDTSHKNQISSLHSYKINHSIHHNMS